MSKGKKTMSRRERVIAALEHREPDRVPISMSITIDAYNNLKEYLGIDLEEKLSPGRWTEVPMHPDVAEKFGGHHLAPYGQTPQKAQTVQ